EGLIDQCTRRTRIATRPPVPILNEAIVVLSHRQIRPSTDYHDTASHGLSEATVRGALQDVTDAGSDIFMLHPGNLTDAVVRRVLDGKPRGVVFPWLPFKQYDHVIDRVHRTGVPLVVYGDRAELEAFDRVYTDHVGGAYQLTRRLLEM